MFVRTFALGLLFCLLNNFITIKGDEVVNIFAAKQDNILNKEVKDAIFSLQNNFGAQDQPFIRFFSTYNIPADKQEITVLTASFVLHSLIGVSNKEDANAGSYYPLAISDNKEFKPLRQVKDSKTLWWIDLREYNFTEQAWELVSQVDPYFVEPIVHNPENGLLRLLAGNAVVRMDWFIYHATDIGQEIDAGRKTKIYNTLLYALNKEPKNVDEFQKVWGLPDVNKSRQLGNEYATLVTKSKNVARHNRLLFGYRTELGWLYQSYDTLNQEGLRDYLESIYEFKGKPPTVFDAGEMFATNQVKMQIYALYNDKFDLIDFADPRIARHISDVIGHTAVRVAHSCMDCHSAGPIPSENTLSEFLKARMKLYVPNKGDSLRIERAFLSNKFEDAVLEDQVSFAKSLTKINGLTPEENAKNYLQTIVNYDKLLDLKTVSSECGVKEADIISAAQRGLQNLNYKVPARVDLLIKTGEGIPRDTWDSPGKDGRPGLFQQTMIMLYGLTEIRKEIKENLIVPVIDGTGYTIIKDCNVMSGRDITGSLNKGTIIPDSSVISRATGSDGNIWVQIKYGNISGYVLNENFQHR